MTVSQLIERLNELAAAGHGDANIYVGYNTGGPGSSDGEDCFKEINKADPEPRTLPKGIWLDE